MSSQRTLQRIAHAMVVMSVLGFLTACGGGGDSPLAPPNINSNPLPLADVNQPYSADLTATGSGPFTWTVTGLPQGITVDPATGKLTGPATQPGQFNLAIEVKGPGGTDTENLSMTVLDKTHLASVNSDEVQATGGDSGNGFVAPFQRSLDPGISNTGRFVVFDSAATNLGGTNGRRHVYLRDREIGETQLISKKSDGTQGNNDSHVAVVSDDGRFVAFDSFASNLIDGDSNQARDIFLHDRQTGTTVRISQTPQGTEGGCPLGVGENCNSFDPSMSADGNLIAFGTFATLLPEDLNTSTPDIYVLNKSANTLELATKGVGGMAANGGSGSPQISADGRFVVFSSVANNLVANDPDLTTLIDDVFAYNVASKQITKISVTPDPAVAADGASQNPTISNNGSRIAFSSVATNLGTGDSGIRDVFIVDWNGTSAPTNFRRIGGNAESDSPSLSRDGNFLALHSLATDLPIVPPISTNGQQQIYVLQIGTSIKPASVNSAGQMGNGESRFPAISGDGRFIAYYSAASDLVTPDSNGNAFDAFVSQRP
ncbi:hypothetical protein DNFV4_04580 [Nitrospira tepida]|uniref:Dystroglycan-type cadherin-like domain-containing protein n=1 Tax=Nitrospira tepida TaxID=2973512 RepID=A0AA86N3U3_9BACT|nr:putative Ig domain-containing protein [Nitrospira tepida]CAI4034136.1 hypothetical protein DNFV4_04580 [Nitrospira tepida]